MARGRQIARAVEGSSVFSKGITGFVLLDAQTGRKIADVYGNRYFTPASNVKILTLAASLSLLPDTLPTLQIRPWEGPFTQGQSRLLIRGTGDPTFLHPRFEAWQRPFYFLRQQPGPIWLYRPSEQIQRFGPGWAWDDYEMDFQAERGFLPLYGHLIRVYQYPSEYLEVYPAYFRDSCSIDKNVSALTRRERENCWKLPMLPTGSQPKTFWIPFIPWALPQLLADTLGKRVEWLPDSLRPHVPPDGWQTLYGAPIDTILRRLMHQSDNFIAEQLLLMCARQRFGVFRIDTLIEWLLDSLWTQLPQRPRWVDGSGLSRYNLASPQTIVHLLRQLWHEQPRQRLFNLFPAGGRDGTLARWYAPEPGEPPWVFAKTGTLSGVHCLSGYLVARSGRVLIFSFMHTNFIGSNEPWKREMERLLRAIRQRF
ncbi:MAG: D-alanyl-D-alanine carboxypeptidase [Saprospiraceae bacterium]|nr:D-alanyl-D-alanine carboxypeptidase [Saprospiraceae bacterium]MDW8482932.1 D-alanyl-D-alanine carboxypeptidase [Saprospiraceae bacterium]